MPTNEKYLADIQSANADVRFAAWRSASEADPSVIPQLAKLAAGGNPGVAKAAREAIVTMVHAVGKETGGARRAEIVKQLLEASGSSYPLAARIWALRQLSLLAMEEHVPAIAAHIQNADLREEVVFCLERIPGHSPLKALLAAYKDAKDDFKPRILAALGHRRYEEAVPFCVEAMKSSNKDIATAGVKAFGRIGRKPAAAPRFPDPAAFSDWQKTDQIDSQLRYADAQAKAGNHAEAIRIYKTALERPEEHWQCAGIIGIGNIGTPEAATIVFPKMKSSNRTVRITAQNVWKKMAGPA